MAAFCISIFNHLISCIKKTKCSVESSTIYIGQLFLQLHFLFSKSIKFRRCEKDNFLLLDEFLFLSPRLMSHIDGRPWTNWYVFQLYFPFIFILLVCDIVTIRGPVFGYILELSMVFYSCLSRDSFLRHVPFSTLYIDRLLPHSLSLSQPVTQYSPVQLDH